MAATLRLRPHATRRFAAAVALAIVAGSCGGQQRAAVTDPEPGGGQQPAAESGPEHGDGQQDAVVTAPELAPRTLPEETAPTRYVLSGREVDRATFARALARLVVAREASSGEMVENPDGSYGGASGAYPALDPQDRSRWVLTESVVVNEGISLTTYALERDDPAP